MLCGLGTVLNESLTSFPHAVCNLNHAGSSLVIVNLAVIRRGQGKMHLTVWGEGQQAGKGQGRVSKDGHTFGK